MLPVVEKLPAGHSKQDEPKVNVPAGHTAMHALLPAVEKLRAGHPTQDEPEANVPAGHAAVHAPLPDLEKVPVEHGLQEELPTDENVPAAQFAHELRSN